MATYYLDDPRRVARLPAPQPRTLADIARASAGQPQVPYAGSTQLRAPGSEIIGRRPPIDMGMAERVYPSPALRPTTAPTVAPGAGAQAALPAPSASGPAAPAAAAGSPLSRLARVGGGAAALGGIAGAAQSFDDINSGERDRFQQAMGVETPIGSVAADTARTLANVGDAVTFGLAGRAGRGLSSLAGGGGFVDGFLSPREAVAAPAGQQVAAGGAGAGRGNINPPPAEDAPQQPLSALATAPMRNDVTREGNSYSGAPGINGNITVNGREPRGGFMMADPYGGSATPSADAVIAASTRLNQGAGVIDGAGGDARQKFFDEANLRNAAAQGSWSPRRGFQGNDAAVGAAAIPLVNRARQQLADTASNAALQRTSMEQTGADNRAALSERAADARFGIANQQQQVQNNLAERRLGIEDRRATAAEAAAGVPSGYQRTADGGLTYIKGGPADPETAKGKNTLNDTQAKALQFGTRMQTAGQLLDNLAAGGTSQPGLLKRAADTVGLGTAANWTQSSEQQQVEQAQRDFINATLRRESGAAIAESEFDNARRQYFPQPGDGAEVIAQKKANRELATRGILAEVPNADQRVAQVVGQPAAQAAAAGAASAPSIPAGMSRQVGTSGGKPVYEDAQGNRFIGG